MPPKCFPKVASDSPWKLVRALGFIVIEHVISRRQVEVVEGHLLAGDVLVSTDGTFCSSGRESFGAFGACISGSMNHAICERSSFVVAL